MSTLAKLKTDRRVQQVDTTDGTIFVNLKPGWQWSGQGCFGCDTVAEAWKLTRGADYDVARTLSLYQTLAAAGIEMDSHESDLYVRDTEEARAILANFHDGTMTKNARPFFADDGSGRWIDVPFAYDPFYEARKKSLTAA